jgi:hypothetical protein
MVKWGPFVSHDESASAKIQCISAIRGNSDTHCFFTTFLSSKEPKVPGPVAFSREAPVDMGVGGIEGVDGVDEFVTAESGDGSAAVGLSTSRAGRSGSEKRRWGATSDNVCSAKATTATLLRRVPCGSSHTHAYTHISRSHGHDHAGLELVRASRGFGCSLRRTLSGSDEREHCDPRAHLLHRLFNGELRFDLIGFVLLPLQRSRQGHA